MAFFQRQFISPRSCPPQNKPNALLAPQQQQNLAPTNTNYQKQIEDYIYCLKDSIGEGQFSKVFKGNQISTGEQVAIKVVEVQKITQPIFLTLLQNEIAILRTLDHKNLLRLKEVYSTTNNIYLITEFCNQERRPKLNDFKEKGGPRISSNQDIKTPHKWSRLIVGELYQIIHRDIKPANILVTDGIPKFADFGFAINKQLSQNQKGSLEGFKVGTPLYMAPETLFHNQYTFKTDIWALGCVYYEMLFGVVPFQSKLQKELSDKMIQYSRDGHLNIPNNNQIVSDDSINLLRQLLQYDPQTRISLAEITRLPILNQKQSVTRPFLKRQQSSVTSPSPICLNSKQTQSSDTQNEQSILIDSTVLIKQEFYIPDLKVKSRSVSPNKFQQMTQVRVFREDKLLKKAQPLAISLEQKPLPLVISPEKNSARTSPKKSKLEVFSLKNPRSLTPKSPVKIKNLHNITTLNSNSNSALSYSFNSSLIYAKSSTSTLNSAQKVRSPLTKEVDSLSLTFTKNNQKNIGKESPGLQPQVQSISFHSKVTRKGIEIHAKTLSDDRDATQFCQFIDSFMNLLIEDAFFNELELYITSKEDKQSEDGTQLRQLKFKLEYFATKLQVILLNKYGVVQETLDRYQGKFQKQVRAENLPQDQLFNLIYNQDQSLQLRFFTTYVQYLKICILCFNKYLVLNLNEQKGTVSKALQLSIIRMDYLITTFLSIQLFVINFDDFNEFCKQSEIKSFVQLKPSDEITIQHWNEIKKRIKLLDLS